MSSLRYLPGFRRPLPRVQEFRTGTKRRRLNGPSRSARKSKSGGGILAGRFNNKRGRKMPFVRQGVSIRTQSGTEYAASTVNKNVMIGSTAFTGSRIAKYFCLAILRKLAKKAGIDIKSEHDFIDQNLLAATGAVVCQLVWDYSFDDTDPDVNQDNHVRAKDSTWGTLAENFWSAIVNDCNGHGAGTFNLKKVFLRFYTDNATNVPCGPAAALDLTKSTISYYIKDTVKIQNRTGANAGTEVEADNIEANPLEGRIYVMDKPYIGTTWSNDAVVTSDWSMSSTTGLVNIDTQAADITAGLQGVLHRCPNERLFLKCYKSNRVTLNPGAIKSHTISKKGTMHINTFFNRVLYDFAEQNAPAAGGLTDLGNCHVFMLNKAMQTGTGTAVVTIGVEKQQYHSFTVHEKRDIGFIPDTYRV